MFNGRIYCITCLPTGKLYFGQTVKPIEKRWKHHIKYAQSGCQYKLHRAIRKYGVENFTVEEVMWVEADDRQVLNSKLDFLERFFIKRFNTRYDGFNMTDGGEGFSSGSLSSTHRLNISRAKKGKKRGNLSDEWKRKIGESCKNHPTPYKGSHCLRNIAENFSRSEGSLRNRKEDETELKRLKQSICFEKTF